MRNPVCLPSMASACERLARGEDSGEYKGNPIARLSMANECERPRKSEPRTMDSIIVERIVYAKLIAIRVHFNFTSSGWILSFRPQVGVGILAEATPAWDLGILP